MATLLRVPSYCTLLPYRNPAEPRNKPRLAATRNAFRRASKSRDVSNDVDPYKAYRNSILSTGGTEWPQRGYDSLPTASLRIFVSRKHQHSMTLVIATMSKSDSTCAVCRSLIKLDEAGHFRLQSLHINNDYSLHCPTFEAAQQRLYYRIWSSELVTIHDDLSISRR